MAEEAVEATEMAMLCSASTFRMSAHNSCQIPSTTHCICPKLSAVRMCMVQVVLEPPHPRSLHSQYNPSASEERWVRPRRFCVR